jgi:hypothetical protein
VPRNIKLVQPASLGQIPHHKEFSLSVKHPPAVNDRRLQPGISVVTALKKVELPPCNPMVDFYMRETVPGEWTRAPGLVALVDLQGVMSSGAAQALPIAAVSNVFERTRIEQKAPSLLSQGNAQRVRVAVAATSSTQRPRVDYQLLL